MMERWFPLPDMYRLLNDPETLKRFAKAYMTRNYLGWEPVKINNYRVLARRQGEEDQHIQ
ncbi:hypothetical protein P9578_03520 [Brevibacillus choshinensis]|uniref:hypothetical protein n=1 Tax=Brevibacillus choshinensis TaxID=54911 RepID=UPI002E20253E|nr:hypothetical protein [Brevibacillus choshinensis]